MSENSIFFPESRTVYCFMLNFTTDEQTTTAKRATPNKRFNEQNNGCARAF